MGTPDDYASAPCLRNLPHSPLGQDNYQSLEAIFLHHTSYKSNQESLLALKLGVLLRFFNHRNPVGCFYTPTGFFICAVAIDFERWGQKGTTFSELLSSPYAQKPIPFDRLHFF